MERAKRERDARRGCDIFEPTESVGQLYTQCARAKLNHTIPKHCVPSERKRAKKDVQDGKKRVERG